MNEATHDNGDITARLNRHRLVPPSPALRAKVLGAARQAWMEGPTAPAVVPWVSVFLRLATPAAAAVLLICAAGWIDETSLARWNFTPSLTPATTEEDVWPAAATFVHMRAMHSGQDGGQILQHSLDMQKLLHALEKDPGGVSREPQSRYQTHVDGKLTTAAAC